MSMRFEQACRFRAEGGYRIVSKSPGVTTADERVMEMFSDAMNPLFADPTQSVLTCLGKGGQMAMALSTMGSDIHARRALFTHAVFVSEQEYGELLTNNPAALLGIPLESFRRIDDAPAQMEQLEVEPLELPATSDLMARYGLDATKLGELFEFAASAIAQAGSLCLHSSYVGNAVELVRDFAALIVQGLPASYVKGLTFSSAYDCRTCLCVAGAGRRVGGGRTFDFFIDADRKNTVSTNPAFVRRMFEGLASMEPVARRAALEEMQAWTDRILVAGTRPSLEVLASAYALAVSDGPGDPADDAQVLQCLFALGGLASANQQAVNDEIAALMDRMNAGATGIPTSCLEQVWERALCTKQSTSFDMCCAYLKGLSSTEIEQRMLEVARQGGDIRKQGFSHDILCWGLRELGSRRGNESNTRDAALVSWCKQAFGADAALDEAIVAYIEPYYSLEVKDDAEVRLNELQHLFVENKDLAKGVVQRILSQRSLTASVVVAQLFIRGIETARSFDELVNGFNNLNTRLPEYTQRALSQTKSRYTGLCSTAIDRAYLGSHADDADVIVPMIEAIRDCLYQLKRLQLSAQVKEELRASVCAFWWSELSYADFVSTNQTAYGQANDYLVTLRDCLPLKDRLSAEYKRDIYYYWNQLYYFSSRNDIINFNKTVQYLYYLLFVDDSELDAQTRHALFCGVVDALEKMLRMLFEHFRLVSWDLLLMCARAYTEQSSHYEYGSMLIDVINRIYKNPMLANPQEPNRSNTVLYESELMPHRDEICSAKPYNKSYLDHRYVRLLLDRLDYSRYTPQHYV